MALTCSNSMQCVDRIDGTFAMLFNFSFFLKVAEVIQAFQSFMGHKYHVISNKTPGLTGLTTSAESSLKILFATQDLRDEPSRWVKKLMTEWNDDFMKYRAKKK